MRDRRDPSPQVSRTLERLRQFLTLVGLTALLVGGVGVANAVATYIDRRRKVIAAFKSLGATSRDDLRHPPAAGADDRRHRHRARHRRSAFSFPIALSATLGDALPIKADLTVSARSLLTAVAYGLLVSLLFTLWPLGRAEQVRAGVLFRDEVAPERILPRWRIIALTLGCRRCCWSGFAVFTSEARLLALYYCLGVVGVFAVFLALGTRHRLGGAARRRDRAGPSWRSPSAISERRAGSRARWCCRWAPACRCSSPWRWSIARSSPS